MSTTDYKPNSLATKLIKRFLVDSSLIVSVEDLARQHDVTPTVVRQTLAQAVGREILVRETNDLTGEQEYSAGRHLGSMRHLMPNLPATSPAAPVAVEEAPEEVTNLPQQEASELFDLDRLGLLTAARAEAADLIPLDEFQLADIPLPVTRQAGSRYDPLFWQAWETQKAITMPPQYVETVANCARSWLKARRLPAKVRSSRQLHGCHFGAVWIITQEAAQ